MRKDKLLQRNPVIWLVVDKPWEGKKRMKYHCSKVSQSSGIVYIKDSWAKRTTICGQNFFYQLMVVMVAPPTGFEFAESHIM
jgi:hypothetical protein